MRRPAHPLLTSNPMGKVVAVALSAAILLAGCTGGQEGSAAEEQAPKKNPINTVTTASQPQPPAAVDAQKELKSICAAIPIYANARYREDLTRRDSVMIHNQY